MEYQNEITVKVAGQAGQGIESIGLALARLFKDSGFFIFANRDYMSRIRGGNNSVQLRISDRPVHSQRRESDIIFCLDGESVALHLPSLAPGGVLIADAVQFSLPQTDSRMFNLPMYDLAGRVGGSELFVNTVGLGALAGITNRPFPLVEQSIKDTFKDKPADIITRNSAVALAAYDLVRDNRERFAKVQFEVAPEVPGEKLLFMSGHDAVTLGAVKGGCKFYSGYPMTPSTGILELMADIGPRYGVVVEQAEDEIAAINMVLGASFAGCRAMTATSGGGFCLMTEVKITFW
jgi:2-oxoglutarate ferredoxin oxidoreductase subunit alpha